MKWVPLREGKGGILDHPPPLFVWFHGGLVSVFPDRHFENVLTRENSPVDVVVVGLALLALPASLLAGAHARGAPR